MQDINLFHATNKVFKKLDTKRGFGAHLGTKKAALARMKALINDPVEFEIEQINPSKKDYNCKKLMDLIQLKESDPTALRMQRAKQQGFDPTKVYYHGTTRFNENASVDIHQFSKAKVGERCSLDSEGFFFSNQTAISNNYSALESFGEDSDNLNGANYPVLLKLSKPMIVDEAFLAKENMSNVLGVREDVVNFWDIYHPFLLEEYHSGNFDSILIRDESQSKDNPVEMPIVFEPNQVRSVTSFFHPKMAHTSYLHELSVPSSFERILLIDKCLEQVAPKTSLDPDELLSKIELMSTQEIKSVMSQYKSLPNSYSFDKSVMEANMGNVFRVKADNKYCGTAKNKSSANKIVRDLKKSLMKEVTLSVERPLRLPDLGIWSSEIIANELSLSGQQREEMALCHNETDKFDYLKSLIFEMGYDSVVYKNEVEAKGHDSYIALKDDQILYPEEMEIEVSCTF